MIREYSLAKVGTTGNNNHDLQVNEDAEKIALEFKVEAVGATPTVTFKLQGTLDGTKWTDVVLVAPNSDTGATSQTVTTVDTWVWFVKSDLGRFFKKLRLNTSANMNVTYSAKVYTSDDGR